MWLSSFGLQATHTRRAQNKKAVRRVFFAGFFLTCGGQHGSSRPQVAKNRICSADGYWKLQNKLQNNLQNNLLSVAGSVAGCLWLSVALALARPASLCVAVSGCVGVLASVSMSLCGHKWIYSLVDDYQRYIRCLAFW